MASSGNFWRFILVLLFGGGVAAIGIQELHQKYADSRPKTPAGRKMTATDFNADEELYRASLSPQALEQHGSEDSRAQKGDKSGLKGILRSLLPSKTKE